LLSVLLYLALLQFELQHFGKLSAPVQVTLFGWWACRTRACRSYLHKLKLWQCV